MTLTRKQVIESARSVGLALARQGLERTRERAGRAGRAAAAPRRAPLPGAEAYAAAADAPLAVTRVAGGLVVGIGDSWLDYFWYDILDQLEDQAFSTRKVARHGTTLADIAYKPDGQLDRLALLLQQLPPNDRPVAIVLSGGGNDVVAKTPGGPSVLQTLLTDAGSGLPPLIDAEVDGLVDVRLRAALATTLTQITAHCESILGAKRPILLHGYGNPVPDGRGLLGSWLKPAFDARGWNDRAANTAVMQQLIGRLNAMQQDTLADAAFEHAVHVDVRPVLSSGADWEDWWENELHPTQQGFAAVAARVAQAIPG